METLFTISLQLVADRQMLDSFFKRGITAEIKLATIISLHNHYPSYKTSKSIFGYFFYSVGTIIMNVRRL